MPVLCWSPSRSAAPASGPISAKATGVRPAAGFARYGYGGGPIAFLARGHRSRFAGSAPPTPGVKIRPIGAITARSGGRPMNQATASGATTPSTTFFSNSITTRGPGLPVAAAPCSSTSLAQAWRRPPAVSPCTVTTFWHWSRGSRERRESLFILSGGTFALRRSPCRPARGSRRTRSPSRSRRSCPWRGASSRCDGRSERSARSAAPGPRRAAGCT